MGKYLSKESAAPCAQPNHGEQQGNNSDAIKVIKKYTKPFFDKRKAC